MEAKDQVKADHLESQLLRQAQGEQVHQGSQTVNAAFTAAASEGAAGLCRHPQLLGQQYLLTPSPAVHVGASGSWEQTCSSQLLSRQR